MIHVREFDNPSESQSSPPLPPVRWDLVVALKQLLRESHRKQATLVKPRPSTAGFLERPEVRNAGVTPLKGRDAMQLETKTDIFSKFMDKVKHVCNTELLQGWLSELCSASVDPTLRVMWQPDPSFTLTVANLIVTDSLTAGESKRCNVRLVLKVGQVVLTRDKECGGEISFQLQRETLLRILKHEVVFQQMKNTRKLALDHGWHVAQETPHPLQSIALAKLQDQYSEMSSLLLESSDRQRKMELLFGWSDLTVTAGRLISQEGVTEADQRWETKNLRLQDVPGSNNRDKMSSLFTSYNL